MKRILIALGIIILLVLSALFCSIWMEPTDNKSFDYARVAIIILTAASAGVMSLYLIPDFDVRKKTMEYEQYEESVIEMYCLDLQGLSESQRYQEWEEINQEFWHDLTPRERAEAHMSGELLNKFNDAMKRNKII